MNDKPHLDEEALAELQDVMEDEFDVLIQTYLEDSRTRIQSLRDALADADSDQFSKAAHSFKGSCVNIGAPRLGELCFDAEKLGKNDQLDQAPGVMTRIEKEFEDVAWRLQHFNQ
ncbi:Hpt domain-containing protein [Marinobacter sp. SS5-14b]|uniref:Hpt domain-containing protein n=1 Tax=Marinobacter sp. SS5-14b TaxID=3050456 RepID=UPI0026E08945|nr:Hpt domain-containing protein [Marinobacter sp. SS5-14b]